jgi:glycosyltransferase involved in cell wall biosynthesis
MKELKTMTSSRECFFSVVIPTHNRLDFLKEAIMSAVNQSYPPCEIIVVDDYLLGSVRELVKRLDNASNIPIYYIQNIIKSNAQISRNIGSGCAKGRYISFLDDDDLWDKEYLKQAKKIFSEKPCSVLITHTVAFDNNNNKIVRKLFPNEYSEQEMFIKNPGVACSNIIIDKVCFLKIGGYDSYVNASADKDLLIRLKRKGYTHEVLRNKLVLYRIGHPDQWTSSNIKILPDILRFYKKYFFSMNFMTHIKVSKKIIKIFVIWLMGIKRGKR